MFILSTLIPTFLISMVSTTELSSKTDMSQFIKRHHSKPWLKDASQWLSNYEDLLQKRYEAKEVLPEHLNHDPHGIHLQMQRRLSRKKNKEVDIDRDIWEFTSSINDFLKVAPSRVRSKESQDLLQRLEAARTDLSNLRRKNTEEGPGQKALRGLDRGNKEYYTTLMAKKKAQDIWDKIKSI